MTIVAGDILRTTMNFLLPNNVQYQNVFHHQRTGVGILTDAQHITAIKDWAEVMLDEIEAHVKLGTIEQLCSVDLVEWTGTAWEVTENIGTFTPDFTPSAVTDVCPNQISPFIVFKTSRPKTVGRKFLFPTLEPDQDQGILEAAAVAAIVGYADDAVNNITIQVLDYLVPGVVRTGVNAWLEFTVAIVTDLVGTQRRRRPGTGA